MTASQFEKLWTGIGAVLVYWTVNTWIVTQGGQPVFGLALLSKDPVPAALIAILVCTLLLIIVSAIGSLYARRHGGGIWTSRIPVVRIGSLDLRSTEAKIYQAAVLVIFSLLPLMALIHFWRKVLNAKVVTSTSPPVAVSSIWNWSALTTWNDPARICTEYSDVPKVVCSGNATVLPGAEPWAFAILTAAAAAAVIFHWVSVFRRGGPGG